MICPQCGYDMGNKSKCLRCGYVEKTLAVVDESKRTGGGHSDEPKKDEEKPEVKIIDPCNVYLTHPYGYEDDQGMGFGFGDPFSSLFGDLFGDPIGDLLGGLFGFNIGGSRRGQARGRHEEPHKKRRKQGPIVEIDQSEVEVVDDNGNPVHDGKNHGKHGNGKNDKDKHKR